MPMTENGSRMANIERLVAQHAERAWRLACGLLHNAHDADDAMQQGFIVAAKKSERIPSDDSWPWFAAIVTYEALNVRRMRARRQREDDMTGGDKPDTRAKEPSEEMARAESESALYAALDALPEAERDAITLTKISGLSHREAAETLAMPLGTLNSHVSRGLESLRAKLNKPEGAVTASLAVMPALFAPPGGMTAASVSWLGAAKASVAATAAVTAGTGISTGTVAFAGGTLMGKKIALIAGIVVGVIVGGLGGAAVYATMFAGVEPKIAANAPEANNRPEPRQTIPVPRETRVRDNNAELVAAREETERLKRELAARDGTIAAMQAKLDTAKPKPEAKPAVPAKPKPANLAVAFGTPEETEGFKNTNWKDVVEAMTKTEQYMKQILDLYGGSSGIGEVLDSSGLSPEAKKKINDLQKLIQNENRKLVDFIIPVYGKLPTHVSGNHSSGQATGHGEMNHPLSLANVIAARLEAAGNPLTTEQAAAVEQLGESYERDWKQAQQSYDATTFMLDKIMDEFQLKEHFYEQCLSLLTPEQHTQVVVREYEGLNELDFHSPMFMFFRVGVPFVLTTREALKTSLMKHLSQDLEIDQTQVEGVGYLFDTWLDEIGENATPSAPHLYNIYSAEQAVIFARAHIKALKGLLANLQLDEAAQKRIRDMDIFYVPRIVPEPQKDK